MKFLKLAKQSRSRDWLLQIFLIVLPVLFESAHCQHYSNACRSIHGKLGTCVHLANCPLFSGWLKQRPLVRKNLRLLVAYTCQFDLQHPKVCCPNDNLFDQDDDFTDFRIGSSRRTSDSGHGSSNANKLTFPTSSLAFPSQPGEDDRKRKANFAAESVSQPEDEGEAKKHVPLIFPSEGQLNSDPKGKAAWNMGKNKAIEGSAKRDLRLHENFKLIPKMHECSNAVKLDSWLGTYAGYPWLALVGMKRRGTLDFEHVCGGAIINKNYILTSAHCFKSITPKFVRLGEYDLDTLIDQGSEFLPQSRRQDYRIKYNITHPDYDPVRGANDIALIRVDKELALNTTFIRPVCLPFLREYGLEDRVDVNDLDGKKFWVAGWSRHSWDGQYSTGLDISVLRDGIVEYTSHDVCRLDYPQLSAFSAKAQICVGGKGKRNSCVPDSGSPLMLTLKVPGRVEGFMEPKYFMFGLLSRGPTGKMCQTNTDEDGLSLPTSVYTKVTKYLPWILDNIRE